MSRDNSISKWLWFIFGLAFMVRVVGIGYGLPAFYNADEPFNVINALAYGAKGSLEPLYFVYPALHSYLLLAVYGIYFVFGTVFGAFENTLDFGAAYFLNPDGLFLVGRFLSVLLGTATVFMVYRIGSRYFSRNVGFLSAGLLAMSFTHTEFSHWILPEPLTAFLCAVALYYVYRFAEKPEVKTVILAGLICGLAVSAKYTAGFVVLSLLLAVLLTYRNQKMMGIKMGGVSIASVMVGFVAGSPYWIFAFEKYWQTLNYSLSHMGTGMLGNLSTMPIIWPFWELSFSDWGVGIVMITGVVSLFFQFDKKQWLLGAFAVPTLLYAGLWNRTGVHYLIPVFPALVILGAVFLDSVLQQRLPRSLKVAFLVLIFAPSLIKIGYNDIQLTQKDTRTYARTWIENNIPEESSIAYENYDYGPNLFDPNRFFKNQEENKLLPVELKERLLQEKRKRISYRLVNLRKDFRLRFLNENSDVAEMAENAYLRQLLETRLPRLSSVKKAGIEYLVVSSYNYKRYLEGRPPEKGTPLWVSYQNGRTFYQNVFQSDDLELLFQVKPGFWNKGPIVKVYKFIDSENERRE